MNSEPIRCEIAATQLTIAVVGGLDRAAAALREAAALRGHRLEHHCGASSGPSKRSLDAMIGRADIVVIVTGHNSHPAASFARAQARHQGVPSLICRRFGPANLARLLDAVVRFDAMASPVLDARAIVGATAGVFCANDQHGEAAVTR